MGMCDGCTEERPARGPACCKCAVRMKRERDKALNDYERVVGKFDVVRAQLAGLLESCGYDPEILKLHKRARLKPGVNI